MLSWLFNILWDLFCSAPWWLEIVIACGVFWILLALLLLFIFIFYHILLFFWRSCFILDLFIGVCCFLDNLDFKGSGHFYGMVD